MFLILSAARLVSFAVGFVMPSSRDGEELRGVVSCWGAAHLQGACTCTTVPHTSTRVRHLLLLLLLLLDSSCEPINHRISGDGKWMVLVGISDITSDCIQSQGTMQLFSIECSASQPIEGHTAAFAELKLDGHQFPISSHSGLPPGPRYRFSVILIKARL